MSASYGSLSRAAAKTHSAVRGSVAGLLDRGSLVLSHTIFRRLLGSGISSMKVLKASRNSYRKSLNALLTPTGSAPQVVSHTTATITLAPHLLDSLLARQANFS